jgi:hypothetical protein
MQLAQLLNKSALLLVLPESPLTLILNTQAFQSFIVQLFSKFLIGGLLPAAAQPL